MDDFDSFTIPEESDSFLNPGAGDRRDDVALAVEVREAVYLEEIAEIARLKEALRLPHLGGRKITRANRCKGNQILDRRRQIVDAVFYGRPIPEPIALVAAEPEPTAEPEFKPLPLREQARRRGLVHYLPKKPCKRGHTVERLVSNGACAACDQQWTAEKRAKKKAEA